MSQELFKEFELSLSFRYHIKFPQKSYFQDYENDALVHLKRILANKWDFVVMQAEEQVSSVESRIVAMSFAIFHFYKLHQAG